MKNILIITNEFNYGGIGRYTQKLLPKLNKTYEVCVLSRDKIDKKFIKQYDIKKDFQIEIPRIINIWPLKEFLFFLYGIIFFHSKKFDFIISNYPVFIPKSTIKDSKIIQVIHSLHKQFVFTKTPIKLSFLLLKLFHFMLIPLDQYRIKTSDEIVCISKSIFFMIKSNKKIYIPNVLEKRIKFKINKFSRKKIKIIIIARDDPFKGTDLLKKFLDYLYLDNFLEYSNIYFIVVGIKKLREYPNTLFLGKTSFEKVKEILKDTNIFISTSYLENTPNTIFEAMENGNIPLVSDVGDCKLILNDQDLIFRSNNLADLIKKFDKLVNSFKDKEKDIHESINKINHNYNNSILLRVEKCLKKE